MEQANDEALIQQFLAGEVQAFNLLVWRWQKPILNFVYRYVGNLQDAEDVCQRTFIKAYKNLKQLKNPTKFSTWLYQIAANQAKDALRRQKKGNCVSIPFHDSGEERGEENSLQPCQLKAEDEQPDAAVHQRELQQILQQVIMKLPKEQRVVVIMKIYQELKFNEIAEVLGVPVNTVKSRMYYGLSSMRQFLKQMNIGKEVLYYEM